MMQMATYRSVEKCITLTSLVTPPSPHLTCYRFNWSIDTCFKDIMTLVNKNKNYFKYFDDKGRSKVPRKYLILWEKGYRDAAIAK